MWSFTSVRGSGGYSPSSWGGGWRPTDPDSSTREEGLGSRETGDEPINREDLTGGQDVSGDTKRAVPPVAQGTCRVEGVLTTDTTTTFPTGGLGGLRTSPRCRTRVLGATRGPTS